MLGVLSVAFTFGSQTTDTAATNPPAGNWTIVDSPNSSPTPSDNFPSAVACVSASDRWTVGNYNNVSTYQTLIEHWDGTSWSPVSSPTTSPIPMGVLLGEVNASRRTDAGDVTVVRNNTVSIPDQQTFRYDVNTSGRIDAGDVTVVRNSSVTVLA
jgi:hypothetical protein